jgi:hypothetical protein
LQPCFVGNVSTVWYWWLMVNNGWVMDWVLGIKDEWSILKDTHD